MFSFSGSKQRQETEFAEFLERIEGEGPSGEEDRDRIALFPEDRPARRELSIPRQPLRLNPFDRSARDVRVHHDFLAHGNRGEGVQVFDTIDDGIAAFGWSAIPKIPAELAPASGRLTPDGVCLGEGSFGYVMLVYMKKEAKVKLEHRHLAAVKVQPKKNASEFPASEVVSAWIEINVLRGCIHPNIVAFYGHFAVCDDVSDPINKMSIVMLLEYASAGDLRKEVSRYDPDAIPESGARYYVKQVMLGLAYLHRKLVLHNDLHAGNVLLRYNRDMSKTAMVADFGQSRVHDVAAVHSGAVMFNATSDVHRVARLVKVMVDPNPGRCQVLSQEVRQIILVADLRPIASQIPKSLKDMLQQYPWFSGEAVAPFPPKTPTPILDPETIRRMGFKTPSDSRPAANPIPILPDAMPEPRTQQLPPPPPAADRRPLLQRVRSSGFWSRFRRRASAAEGWPHARQQLMAEATSVPVILATPLEEEELEEGSRTEAQGAHRHQLLTHSSLRRPLSQRIRRSVSDAGRRLNCFRPRGHRRE